MSDVESPRDQRVLVIGLSTVKNEEVVASLRDLGVDAVGCTEPETAAERHDARQFKVIAFGRAALGPRADRLKQAFSHQNPSVHFVDAFGPIAVAQVIGALQRHPGSPVLVDNVAFAPDDHGGGQITATALIACHITITLHFAPIEGTTEGSLLLDTDIPDGPITWPVTNADLSDAYSLVVIANDEEIHHVPFLCPDL